jgi:hypothetical protein
LRVDGEEVREGEEAEDSGGGAENMLREVEVIFVWGSFELSEKLDL